MKEATETIEAEVRRLWRQAVDAVTAALPENLADGTCRQRPRGLGKAGRGRSSVAGRAA